MLQPQDNCEDFESLENVEKSSYVLDSELWESKFNGLLSLVKEYIVDVWEIRKGKLYASDSGSSIQLYTRSSPGERNGTFSLNGKLVRIVSLVRIASLVRMVSWVRMVECI